MKYSLSPDNLCEDGIMNMATFLRGFEEKGLKSDRPGDQFNKEKKKILFSFCDVCNIQLNSAAQAQVHYDGKSHRKRVKQLSDGQPPPPAQGSGPLLASSCPCPCPCPGTNTSTGSACHTTTLPALVRTPTLMMQPSLDIKPFMSFPVDSSSAVGLFPNFNTKRRGLFGTNKFCQMDPVQKAVINHTFGVSIPPKKKQVISCNVCQLRFNSDSQAEAHYKGSKHAKKVKALEATKNKPKMVSSKDSAKANPSCSIRPITGDSSDKSGSKHKTMVEARNGAGPIKSYPRPGSRLKMQNGSKGSGLQNKTFHCEICDVHVNSEIQLKQHISSRRHKDRVAGKPLKPKYSPYNKLQRSPSILAAKLAFQKDLMKPLAPTFLSSPLAAAAVSSALSLPPRPSTSLFQAAALPPALLRPGHGPIRATPASILFAPY
ncbi:zinc finger protein 385B isoform X3 [Phodopus roborovskii]|uniref:zinc finger protein 385B isoform X3 n=1 Tax=Phodopus roborovskii TaxID=109678 RepID=UPI0021E49BF6|nr:zinc finger protein 385B isoform X3 [Phodopus roborovskii]